MTIPSNIFISMWYYYFKLATGFGKNHIILYQCSQLSVTVFFSILVFFFILVFTTFHVYYFWVSLIISHLDFALGISITIQTLNLAIEITWDLSLFYDNC